MSEPGERIPDLEERLAELEAFFDVEGLREEEMQQLSYSGGGEEPNQRPKAPRKAEAKVGRNDPCPCGSGKKYKKCHGQPGAPPLPQEA